MKKLALMVFTMLMVVSLFSVHVSAEELRVAMLLPGPINDGGWNEMAYESLKEVEEKLDVEVEYSEKTSSSEFESIFRSYAVEGYNLIIGHGFQYEDPAKRVAEQFPETNFIVTSSVLTQKPNVGSFIMNDTQAGFLQGVIAGLLTETNKIGTVGGEEIPPIKRQLNGFEKGAEYINSEIEVIKNYTNSYSDLAKAKEMGYAMIENDIDVLSADANEAGLGVMEAAAEKDIAFIGSTGDIGEEHPDKVVTSLVEHFPKGFLEMIREIKNEGFEPKNYKIGLENDAITIAPYRAYKDKLTEEDKEKIEDIKIKLKEGKINIDKIGE